MLMECGAGPVGAVTSYASAGKGGPGPMEINLVQQGAREGAKAVTTGMRVKVKVT